jgi:flagellar biosynthesis protein FliR
MINFSLSYLPYFLLVFVRFTSFYMTAPVWMDRKVPAMFKLGFAFFTSVVAMGIYQPDKMIDLESADYLFLVLKELAVGLCLGFFTAIIFYAVHFAGSMIDLQSGFAMATMFDPQTGVQEPLTGRFYYLIAITFFLSINGHHLLIRGVLASFDWMPVSALMPAGSSESLLLLALDIMKNMFWISLLIAAPIAGTLFLVDLALGILSKSVPQMNLFVVGIPVKMIVHFMVLYVALPSFFFLIGKLVNMMVDSLEKLLKILGT